MKALVSGLTCATFAKQQKSQRTPTTFSVMPSQQSAIVPTPSSSGATALLTAADLYLELCPAPRGAFFTACHTPHTASIAGTKGWHARSEQASRSAATQASLHRKLAAYPASPSNNPTRNPAHCLSESG